MIDLGDRSEGGRVFRDARIEFFGFKILGKAQRHEVAPLLAAAEPVDEDGIFNAVAIELPHQRTADQASRAGDDRAALTRSVHPRAAFDETTRSASRITA